MSDIGTFMSDIVIPMSDMDFFTMYSSSYISLFPTLKNGRYAAPVMAGRHLCKLDIFIPLMNYFVPSICGVKNIFAFIKNLKTNKQQL